MSDTLHTPNSELLNLQNRVIFYFFGPSSSRQYSEDYLLIIVTAIVVSNGPNLSLTALEMLQSLGPPCF